jgi:putative beta-barrel porin BBP2
LAAQATTRSWTLGLGLAAMLSAGAGAAERFPSLDLNIEGSVPLQYTDNASRSAHKQSDVLLTPYLRLSATGHLQADLDYTIYASGGHDRFGRIRDNDDTFASLGGNIVKRWGRFSFGTSYEHAYVYDGVFAQVVNVTNDVNIFARYSWRPDPYLRVTPGITAAARFNEFGAFQRNVYSLKMDIERRLFGRWWWVTTPRFRYYDYAAANAGRRDALASVSTGLRYEFNDDVSFTTAVGYEQRTSNVAGKAYDNFTAGASLDFSYNFERLR